jgi:Fur family ferric uptake transcriptional regulator
VAESRDEVGEGGVGADVAREYDVAEAGEFRFGAELPDGDTGQGLAEDERAAHFWAAPYLLLVADDSHAALLEYGNAAACGALGRPFLDLFGLPSHELVAPDAASQQEWAFALRELDDGYARHATVPRLTILELFQKSGQRHMSAEDVYRLVLQERADFGLATIYRVLMQFEQAGLLTRSQFESGKAVYELNEGQHHDHLVCLDCGRVEEFFDEEIEKRQHGIARAKGFEIADHALSLYAHCTRKPCPFKNT